MTQEEAAAVVGALFESWYGALVRYARRWTGAAALAEDLVQDTFIELYRVLRDGKAIDNRRAWTLVVLRRGIGKHFRDVKRTGGWPSIDEAEALGLLPAIPPDTDLSDDELARLLAVLTPREEEVVLLRLDALKYREIAAHLGISASSVNTLLARALQKIGQLVRREAESRSAEAAGHKTRDEEDEASNVPDTLH
jgi:RNA polymerase sigma-70 factor, ECF subfamily